MSDTVTCSFYMWLLSFPEAFSDFGLCTSMPCLSWAGLGAFVRKWYFIGSKGLKALAQMLCFIQSHPQLVETVPCLAHLCVLRRVLAHKQAGCQGQ